MESQEFLDDTRRDNEQIIVKEAEEFAKNYGGRMRRENWDSEKGEPMLKIVLTFKL